MRIDPQASASEGWTQRERKYLEAKAEGLSERQIAERLRLTAAVVERVARSLARKLSRIL